jgi:alpha-D-ribose 1-methylphosphonate 5-triphosphate synthase subunit PhnI
VGYAAARGGLNAINSAEYLLRTLRDFDPSELISLDQLTGRLRLLVDRTMGEAGLWAPQLTALAIRQSEGDITEAVHLLRSYKSTLPRLATAIPVHTDEMKLLRRVVPAFREPGGPQILGRSTDYSARMLDVKELSIANSSVRQDSNKVSTSQRPQVTRLMNTLRDMNLLVDRRNDADPEPFDITRMPARPPAPRSARLSTMARAETGALVNQWYRNILGPDGYLHEVTLGEVRHGELPIRVVHPHTGGAVTIGHFRISEVEAIEDLNGIDEDRTKFDVGIGICFGHNERKAIAMANLDIACHRDNGKTSLEQSILMTTDGLDSAGFLEHLKLPHYVTFRSMMERKIAMRKLADVDHSIKGKQ